MKYDPELLLLVKIGQLKADIRDLTSFIESYYHCFSKEQMLEIKQRKETCELELTMLMLQGVEDE